MSKHEKLTKQIAGTDHETEEATKTLAEAEARIANAQSTLDDLWQGFKSSVMDGRESDIQSVQKSIEEARARNQRDLALAEGLRERIQILEHKRAELVKERDELITEAADKKWLPSEIEQYERARRDLLRCTRRLLAACSTLNQTDEGREVTRRHVGEVITRLPAMKIPSVRAFDLSLYGPERRDSNLTASPQERRDVLAELTK